MSEETRVELNVQRGIRQSEDKLVTAIQEALDSTTYGKKLRNGKKEKLEESQFRNLVRVADTTESSEVIKNFIRYQIGRDEKWGRGENSLANRIIHDIDNSIKKRAKKIADDNKIDINPIWLELIRRYLGYGARYLTYLNKKNS